jgi:hypothetical protein
VNSWGVCQAYGQPWVTIGKCTEFFDLLLALPWGEKSVRGRLKLISYTAGGALKLAASIAHRLLRVADEGGHGGDQ